MSMRSSPDKLCVFAIACVLFNAGCQSWSSSSGPTTNTNNGLNRAASCTHFAPDRIDILPLTEYVPADQAHRPHINLYVSLLDPFGSHIKSPGVFRFELYEHVPRSAKPKGRRLEWWPDVDLTDLAINDRYWRDFLHAYEFPLPLAQTDAKSRILQVTYICPTGKLITCEFTLRKAQ